MKKFPRILILLAALALLPTFLVPLWTISLEAPQYPEGIGMYIWLHQITGHDKYDLRRINQLNHYIGMKEITAESIPELRVMPYIVGFLALFGLMVAVRGSFRWLAAWLVLFLLMGLAGLVDFYLWGRDYGTDLDPRAPLKIPGLTYQPPLIGSKQLLNITAHSYPSTGGILLFVSLALGLSAAWLQIQPRGRKAIPVAAPTPGDKWAGRSMQAKMAVLFLALAPIGLSCSPQPVPIELGLDQCVHCRMSITNPRYGAQLLTHTGRSFKFDSVECLAASLLDRAFESSRIHSLWVVNFASPKQFEKADKAIYLHSGLLKSPMGLSLTAFGDPINAGKVQAVYTGRFLTWDEVLDLVGQAWSKGTHTGLASAEPN